MSDAIPPRGSVGDIWFFTVPPWPSADEPHHWLILDMNIRYISRYDETVHYRAICLETGEEVHDLLLDNANLQNYHARKVA